MNRDSKVVPRPKYRAMMNLATEIVREISEAAGPFGVDPRKVFAERSVNVAGRLEGIERLEAEIVWPSVVKALGLIKDDFGSWTLPGRNITRGLAEDRVVGAINRIVDAHEDHQED